MRHKGVAALCVLLCGAGLVAAPAGASPARDGASLARQVTYAQARKILLRAVVKPGSLAPGDDLIAFRLAKPLTNGQVVSPFLGLGPAFRAKGRWWFFWVDDEPFARYAHATRYVFVNQATGKLRVVAQSWWPLVGGEAPWFTSEEYWDASSWAFSTVPKREPPPAAPARPAGRTLAPTGLFTEECAIIVDGAGDQKAGTPEDVAGMVAAMEIFGFTHVEIDAPASKQLLEESVALAAQEGCKDMLIYISSHGVDQQIVIGGRMYTAAELNALMARYPAVEFKIVLDACRAGSWIEPLGKRPKIIITSSNFDEVSYGDTDTPTDPNPGDVGGEFTSGLVEDLKAIPTDPALLDRVRDCLKLGRPLLVCKLGLAFESALEKDANARAGKTHPRKVVND